MENSVTLDLKTYTDLIRENETLKTTIKGFRRAFETDLDDYYSEHDYTFTRINDKEKLKAIVDEKNDVKVMNMAGFSDYGIKGVAKKYEGAYLLSDAYAYLADVVRNTAKEMLSDLEDDQQ